MEDFLSQIDDAKLPEHVAVIMDGNGRWAKEKNKPRVFGHKNGVTSVREVSEACAELGVKFLTLYAFSTENWSRPKAEVTALMTLLVETVRRELKTLSKNKIRLHAIGNIEQLPKATQKALLKGIEETKDNDRMTLTLALNYSARWEIMNATQKIAQQVEQGLLKSADVTEAVFTSHLETHNMPDPALLIRTSGEMRISNYLLWQLAYTELYFSPVYWPDFRKNHLYEAIVNFQQRERRFGKTSDQLQA